MKIFTSEQVREIDAYTIKNDPVSSIDLMERASKAFTIWFIQHIDLSHKVIVFAGPGNNGGDALAITRMLKKKNYNVKAYLLRFTDSVSPDCLSNYNKLKEYTDEVLVYDLKEGDDMPPIKPNTIIIDGIFGSGLNRTVTGFPARIIDFINTSGAKVVSIDIPSGLSGEDNRQNMSAPVVRANNTVTFQFPFLSFFFVENYIYTGDWWVLNINLNSGIFKKLETGHYFITRDFIHKKIKTRPKFSHKGTFGHALIVSGSYGMMGASVITTKACLRGGAGLVTAHIPSSGYGIVQTAVPEALVSLDKSDAYISEIPSIKGITAIGIGPGLSTKMNDGFLPDLFQRSEVPLVIDADGLNLLSAHKEWYGSLPENTILTPHPKEFDRLAGVSDTSYERHLKQVEFSKKYRVVIVLKGAYTIISLPDGRSFFNTSGNPGMATGGSGDVLTGLIVSLLAQSYTPEDAALIGVYVHGLAGDLAMEKTGEISLIAGDITDHFGQAFRYLDEKMDHRK